MLVLEFLLDHFDIVLNGFGIPFSRVSEGVQLALHGRHSTVRTSGSSSDKREGAHLVSLLVSTFSL